MTGFIVSILNVGTYTTYRRGSKMALALLQIGAGIGEIPFLSLKIHRFTYFVTSTNDSLVCS